MSQGRPSAKSNVRDTRATVNWSGNNMGELLRPNKRMLHARDPLSGPQLAPIAEVQANISWSVPGMVHSSISINS